MDMDRKSTVSHCSHNPGTNSWLLKELGFLFIWLAIIFSLCVDSPGGGDVFAHCKSAHGELLSEASHLRASCSPLYNKQIQHISQT